MKIPAWGYGLFILGVIAGLVLSAFIEAFAQ
jgi:hypothetical protein